MRVGDQLVSAERLNARYHVTHGHDRYGPAFVYITQDVRLAESYAAGYTSPFGLQRPGTVYAVRPIGRVETDPDYSSFPNICGRCESAEIVAVLRQAVSLSQVERMERQRKYMIWGSTDRPIYDARGYMLPSAEMANNGVTRAYLRLLPAYLDIGDIGPRGRLKHKDGRVTLDLLFANVAAFDNAHIIRRSRQSKLACGCGFSCSTQVRAIWHQVGERELLLCNSVYHLFPDGAPVERWPEDLAWLAAGYFSQRQPDRWTWLIPNEP